MVSSCSSPAGPRRPTGVYSRVGEQHREITRCCEQDVCECGASTSTYSILNFILTMARFREAAALDVCLWDDGLENEGGCHRL